MPLIVWNVYDVYSNNCMLTESKFGTVIVQFVVVSALPSSPSNLMTITWN